MKEPMRKLNFLSEQDATDENFISHDFDVDAIVKELRSGDKGFVVVPGVFPPEEIAEARERILALIDSQGEKATHFQACLVLQKTRRVALMSALI